MTSCLNCGKPLTQGSSIKRGLGPDCYSKLHGIFDISNLAGRTSMDYQLYYAELNASEWKFVWRG